MRTPTKPDWDFWGNMPEVELWQACAVSLDLDPDAFSFDSNGWMAGPGDHGPFIRSESFRTAEEMEAFHKRLKLLKANLHLRQHFSAGMLHMAQSYRHGVKLLEFARWALRLGWSMPEALTLLAGSNNLASGRDEQIATAVACEPVPAKPAIRAVQRGAAQDESILKAIEEAGFQPRALPENASGKSGVKAQVRLMLDSDPLFIGKTVFNKAWERLRSRREIATGSKPTR